MSYGGTDIRGISKLYLKKKSVDSEFATHVVKRKGGP